MIYETSWNTSVKNRTVAFQSCHFSVGYEVRYEGVRKIRSVHHSGPRSGDIGARHGREWMQTGQVRYLTVYGTEGTSRADYIISLEGDRDGRYEVGRGSEKRGPGVWGRSACFPGGEVCCAHPRAHQRNHPPTIDYYLSNLHSNRALVQICTPCFDPFGNPLQILLRCCDSSFGIVSVTCSTFFFPLLFFSPLQSSRACSRSIVFRRDSFSTFPWTNLFGDFLGEWHVPVTFYGSIEYQGTRKIRI